MSFIGRVCGLAFAVSLAVRVASAQCTAEESQKLLASDAAPFRTFGHAVVVSGDLALVGAPSEDRVDPGAAYVLRWQGDQWVEEQKLVAADGRSEDFFGWSVAISLPFLVVGAPGHDHGVTDSGSVYLYRHDGSRWIQAYEIRANNAGAGDWFGHAVSLDHDLLAVAAIFEDSQATDAGAVYLYAFDGTAWSQERKLTARDGATDDWFGWKLSLEGDLLASGAHTHDASGLRDSGQVYLHRRTIDAGNAKWREEAVLTAPTPSIDGLYGTSVWTDDGRVLVGAVGEKQAGVRTGAAFLYELHGTSWDLLATLSADLDQVDSAFGVSCCLDGDRALIGAYFDDARGREAGSASVFRDSGRGWVRVERLLASDGEERDWLGGFLLGLSGDHAVVGAKYESELGERAGAAYAYTLPDFALQADPPEASEGEEVLLRACGGTPDGPLALFAWEIDGSFLGQLLFLDPFSSSGEWESRTSVPSGLSGVTLTLRAFTCGDPAKHTGVLSSNPAIVTIR